MHRESNRKQGVRNFTTSRQTQIKAPGNSRLVVNLPIRMRRPSAAREALGLSPLVQAGGTYSRVRTYSTHGCAQDQRSFCGVTSHTAGNRYEGRTGRGSSVDRGRQSPPVNPLPIPVNRLVTREGAHVPILWRSSDARSRGRLPFDLALFGAEWARSHFQARSRTTWAAYVRRGAS